MMVRWLVLCITLISFVSLADSQTWYFVRHFEKQQGDNPNLTAQGQVRAENLAKYFADKPVSAIFSTQYHRTLETAVPTALNKQLEVQPYDPRILAPFAEQLASQNHALVVGHSNTTPQLIQLMGGRLIEIKESDFGTLFILQKEGQKEGQNLTVSEVMIPL